MEETLDNDIHKLITQLKLQEGLNIGGYEIWLHPKDFKLLIAEQKNQFSKWSKVKQFFKKIWLKIIGKEVCIPNIYDLPIRTSNYVEEGQIYVMKEKL